MNIFPPVVYTAPWILPIGSDAIRDGAVVVDSETILDIGPGDAVTAAWHGCQTVGLSGVVIPPLINCHIHLELSHIAGLRQPSASGSMVDWIAELIACRQLQYDEEVVHQARMDMVARQKKAGVVLMADVGNLHENHDSAVSLVPEIYPILEVLAPTRKQTAEILQQISALPAGQAVSPHAPYSATADLLVALKSRARSKNHVFSIHLAESVDERTLLRTKKGSFRKFLEKRKSWDNTLLPAGYLSGSVDYLEKLGVLDERTLCVHCVDVDEAEINTLSEHGVKVCLCPGSNRFLRTGPAPLEKMLEAGMLPGIGTDSKASNEDPDMWGEMRILHEHHPGVDASALLGMATLGGARALHREDDFGTLDKGRKPVFLEIEMSGFSGLSQRTEKEVLEELVWGDKARKINWIHSAEKI